MKIGSYVFESSILLWPKLLKVGKIIVIIQDMNKQSFLKNKRKYLKKQTQDLKKW